MARCGSLSSPSRLMLLLLVVLGDAVATAMARKMLGGIAEPPLPGVAAAEGPQPGGGRHDRSIAGAEVILAGFAAAVMAVVFCYIRVTRKSNVDRAAGLAAGTKAYKSTLR